MATTTPAPPALDPLDFLALDALLDEEEGDPDTVRQFVRERVPEVGDWLERGIRRELLELAGPACSGCTSTATGPGRAPSRTG